MPRVASTMLELGTPCPSFDLPDYGTTGDAGSKTVSSSSLAGAPASVVMFICNHCPFVKHINAEMAAFGRDMAAKGVRVVAINANDVESFPDDAPAKMTETAAAEGFSFPYLYDADQSVAKAFRAACTPDFYVFDKDLKLTYRGQLDDSRPGSDIAVTGADLRAAVDATIAGDLSSIEQKPSIGCNIKWVTGAEPDYFNA